MLRKDYEFLPAALEVHETPPHPAARAILWTILVFFLAALAWAFLGRTDVVAIAPGKIIPSGHVKTVQAAEPGTIQAIHVRDGQRVSRDEVLIELDPTRADAEDTRVAQELTVKRAETVRLTAMLRYLEGDDVSPDAGTRLDGLDNRQRSLQQALLDSQLDDYRARLAVQEEEMDRARAELATQRLEAGRLERVLPLITRRTGALAQLRGKQLAPESDYLALEQTRVETEQQLAIARSRAKEIEARIEAARRRRVALQTDLRLRTTQDLQTADREVRALEQEARKSRRSRRGQVLRAPIDGTVQGLSVHTVGGVVAPGQELMHIVPTGGGLEVEAWLANRDVGFVHPGQRGEVKVETFPFTRYGVIEAEVTDVSRDAVERDKLGLVYALRASLAGSELTVKGKPVHLTPGMAVSLEIKTGRRRLIEFLLSPLLRGLKESARER